MSEHDTISGTGPESAVRRSFHYRDLVAAGAHFRTFGDATIAAYYDAKDEAGAAGKLGLIDLSPLPRVGFKGQQLGAWMAAQKSTLGPHSNRAYLLESGALAARLAPTEVLVLSPLDGSEDAIAALEAAWSYEVEGVWPVPRRDASFWFMITGEVAAKMFSKICGVDLRRKSFGNGAIAQTSVARTNAIVIRDDIGETTAFHLLGDSASASFMWSSLLDAMAEYGGRPVGFDALQSLVGARLPLA